MKFVPNAVSRKVGRTALIAGKHSPTILFAGGVVGFGATVVLACKATLKVEEVLVEHQKKMQDVETVQHKTYTEKDRKHDKAILYTQTIVKLGRLYGPSIALGTLSVAALTGSHHILSKRNAGLTAAYAALERGFNEYRARVRGELGEEKDLEFRHGTIEVKETVEGKNGPETKTKKVLNPSGRSIYARIFDEFNPNWQSVPELNKVFLSSVQNYMNDRLHARGHLFLNEVYDALGLERSKAGALVGWTISDKGDNFVDFGIFNGEFANNQFVNGQTGAVLLDFNVDGLIYNELSDEVR